MGMIRVNLIYEKALLSDNLITNQQVFNIKTGDMIHLKHRDEIWTVKQFQVNTDGWVNMKVGLSGNRDWKDFFCSPLDYKCHRGINTRYYSK